ncbi:winged helix-turn-helix transcriptional regulator [Paracoccus methylarcula]|uniref:Transcriptional regulator n=1 Tax=Paracoccus methylarcula TaxID=72022 RepID=A0A422QWQ2_9RHOB|nr:winged helix-turn-helix transcriptional regulator [Paracoccus methylarcula]RNF34384.1 transcriptional regulator [Paracoccus methylarcula]
MPDYPKASPMRYDEGSPEAHALNLVGDRWPLLVVRELIFAPKRFQRIRAGLPGISANVLSRRLAQLGAAGVIVHDEKQRFYALTEIGRELLPVIHELCRWAVAVPGHDLFRFISPTALMISMNAVLVPERARGREAIAGFDFGSEAFEVRLTGGKLQVIAVNCPETPFVLSGNGNGLAEGILGAVPLPELMAKGMVSVSGDVAAASEFLSLFNMRQAS